MQLVADRQATVTEGYAAVTLVPLGDVLDYLDYLGRYDSFCEAFCVTGGAGVGLYCVDTGAWSGDGEFRGLRPIAKAAQA